ncbi:hypothetical protein LSH36_22g08023, partial [Paralvinella palmiformis]
SILGLTLFNAVVKIILLLAVTTGTKLHVYTDDLVLISNGVNPFRTMQQYLQRLTTSAECLLCWQI